MLLSRNHSIRVHERSKTIKMTTRPYEPLVQVQSRHHRIGFEQRSHRLLWGFTYTLDEYDKDGLHLLSSWSWIYRQMSPHAALHLWTGSVSATIETPTMLLMASGQANPCKPPGLLFSFALTKIGATEQAGAFSTCPMSISHCPMQCAYKSLSPRMTESGCHIYRSAYHPP